MMHEKTNRFILYTSVATLMQTVSKWRNRNETIAFTNGVFDILHIGHLRSLEQAAKFADHLIVGVNSDISAKLLGKGPGRPLNSENDRAMMLAGFREVDAVVLFNEPTPYELLSVVRPDVLVKGSDYRIDQIIGREFAGRVERIELIKDRSTTDLVDRILALSGKDDV
ncbi:MAG: adenylyltransferase/cytidyltransferase family protein [Candidatus Electryoneaceae bacterium]|nr:adenylyltransferase/cytidyltransferase family protein [Candidatus Electryoneaceae bacterium]